jgi:hypothetical protein
MTQPIPTKIRVRDIAIGFFGWFLFGNIGYLPFLFHWQPSLLMVPVITVIVMGVLFFIKRNRVAYGIAAAVIINTLILILLLMSFQGGRDWSFLMWIALRIGPSFPLPMGFLMALQGPF